MGCKPTTPKRVWTTKLNGLTGMADLTDIDNVDTAPTTKEWVRKTRHSLIEQEWLYVKEDSDEWLYVKIGPEPLVVSYSGFNGKNSGWGMGEV